MLLLNIQNLLTSSTSLNLAYANLQFMSEDIIRDSDRKIVS